MTRMTTSASNIATQVLEKTARNRAAKEFAKNINRYLPHTKTKGLSVSEVLRRAQETAAHKERMMASGGSVYPRVKRLSPEAKSDYYSRLSAVKGGVNPTLRKKILGEVERDFGISTPGGAGGVRGYIPKPKGLTLSEENLLNITDIAKANKRHFKSIRRRPDLHPNLQDIRTAHSHLHPPRKNEVVIPASGRVSSHALDPSVAANSPYLFRGNTRPGRDQGYWWASRNPDVASTYANASGGMRGVSEWGSQRVYAYNHPPAHRVFEGPHFAYRSLLSTRAPYRVADLETQKLYRDAHIMNKNTTNLKSLRDRRMKDRLYELRHRRGVRNRGHQNRYSLDDLSRDWYLPSNEFHFARRQVDQPHMRFGEVSPTYETILPPSVRPKIIGEYQARPSVTRQGMPGYAISDVRGMPASETMRDFVNKVSPAHRDLR